MTTQTMKRFIALKFTGVKVCNLDVYGMVASGVTFYCKESGRMFYVGGPKEIEELNVKHIIPENQVA